MHWFSKYYINCLGIGRPCLPRKIPPLLRDNLSLPIPLLLVFLDPFILINLVHELAYTGASFPIKDFLKLCSVGRPTLKVLMASSLKSPSISLNISQYLSEYVFRVSPFRMVKDSKKSKGRGTLLQVTNQAPKALVSSLKELIEPSFRLSNHLIATGPKLDGNTLHIKTSFRE